MKYTGSYQLTAGADGIVHASANEAIEARNTGDKYNNPAHGEH